MTQFEIWRINNLTEMRIAVYVKEFEDWYSAEKWCKEETNKTGDLYLVKEEF